MSARAVETTAVMHDRFTKRSLEDGSGHVCSHTGTSMTGTFRPIDPDMDSRTERLVAWLLRSVAGAMTFAGTSALIAAVPLFLFADMAAELRAIGVIVLQIAAV